MERLSSEVLSSIIGDIYDCVSNPEGWAGVMTRVTKAVDAAYTTIALAGTAHN
ncbi:MAG: LuxR family transcriptional regulator, partial [Mesorhizobium sp.]